MVAPSRLAAHVCWRDGRTAIGSAPLEVEIYDGARLFEARAVGLRDYELRNGEELAWLKHR
jgi:hypothetical protein